jgi:hypothetical protein
LQFGALRRDVIVRGRFLSPVTECE